MDIDLTDDEKRLLYETLAARVMAEYDTASQFERLSEAWLAQVKRANSIEQLWDKLRQQGLVRRTPVTKLEAV